MYTSAGPAIRPATPRASEPRWEEILHASARLFADNGYDATSVQDIADAVGILKGSLYHYIDAKDDLLWALTTRLMDSPTTGRLAHLEPLTRLRLIARSLVATQVDNPVVTRAVARNQRSLPEGRRRELSKSTERVFRRFKQAVVDGQRGGVVCPDVDPTFCARAVVSIIPVWSEWFSDGDTRRAQYADAYADLVVAGLACDRKRHRPGHRRDVAPLPVGSADNRAPRTVAPHGDTADDLLGDSSEQLLLAAAKLFVTKGYDATSMQDIADEVGILKGSLYHHIDTKEDLLWEPATRQIAGIKAIPHIRADPLPKLRWFVRQKVLYQIDDQLAFLAVRRNHHSMCEERSAAWVRARQSMVRRYRRTVVDGQRVGTICPDLDPTFTSRIVMTMITGWFEWSGNPVLRGSALADAYADLIVAAVGCDRREHRQGHRRAHGAPPAD